MKREVYSFISGLLLFSCLAISCDDGKIYDENNQTEREGGTVKLTAQINGIDSWPGGYSVVLAGFTPDNAFAQTAKGISQTADGTINMVLAGIPSEVTQIEVCVINKLRKRIASFYTADYTEQADTIRLDAGKLDAGMFNSIQTEIFNRSCTACHGGSTVCSVRTTRSTHPCPSRSPKPGGSSAGSLGFSKPCDPVPPPFF